MDWDDVIFKFVVFALVAMCIFVVGYLGFLYFDRISYTGTIETIWAEQTNVQILVQLDTRQTIHGIVPNMTSSSYHAGDTCTILIDGYQDIRDLIDCKKVQQ